MIKVSTVDEYTFNAPPMELMPVSSRGLDKGWLEKRGSVLLERAAELEPVEGHTPFFAVPMGAYECYGCLAGEMPVWMASGRHKPVKDIHVGDWVFGGSGGIGVISTHYIQGPAKNLYSVKVEGLPDRILMTKNHPVWGVKKKKLRCIRDKYQKCIPNKRGEYSRCHPKSKTDHGCRYMYPYPCDPELTGYQPPQLQGEIYPINELSKGDYVIFQAPKIPFDGVWEDRIALAKIIGYWLAEGCVQEPRSLRFAFGYDEKIPIEDLELALTEYGITYHVFKDPVKRTTTLLTHASELTEQIRRSLGHLASYKKIPAWVFSATDTFKLALLGSYIDGDGTCAINDHDHRCSITTVSRDLALGTQKLLWSLGIPATSNTIKSEYITSGFSTKKNYPRNGYAYKPNDEYPTFFRVNFSMYNAQPIALWSKKFSGFDKFGESNKFRLFPDKRTRRMFLPVRDIKKVEWGKPVYNVEVLPNHTYTSVGFTSKNSNRNADRWTRSAGTKKIHKPAGLNKETIYLSAGLRERHPTFVSDAKCYKHHDNSNPAEASGFIKHSAYNDQMDRVELIGYADNDKWEDEIHKMASGDLSPLSMAGAVDCDYCTYCGHKAQTIAEHCTHVKFNKNAILQDGHQVGMWNENPTFIDLSSVDVNADRLGYGLGLLKKQEKQAAFQPNELAKLAGKLAKIEKKIEGNSGNENVMRLAQGLPLDQDIPDSTLLIVRSHSPRSTFKEMANKELLLPPRQFFRLTGGDAFSKIEPLLGKIKKLLPHIFRTLHEKKDLASVADRGKDVCSMTPPTLEGALEPLKPSLSMAPDHVSLRVTVVRPDKGEVTVKKPKVKIKTKESSFPAASKLAREYAKYQLQFLRDAPRDHRAGVVVSNLAWS